MVGKIGRHPPHISGMALGAIIGEACWLVTGLQGVLKIIKVAGYALRRGGAEVAGSMALRTI
jgi:hypothetical protein